MKTVKATWKGKKDKKIKIKGKNYSGNIHLVSGQSVYIPKDALDDPALKDALLSKQLIIDEGQDIGSNVTKPDRTRSRTESSITDSKKEV